jgi:cell division protein FtsW
MSAVRTHLTGAAAKIDWLLVVVVVALLNIGLMMVYSSTTFHGLNFRLAEDPNRLFFSQLLWLAIGTVVMVALARTDYHIWRKFSIPIMALVLLVLGYVAVAGQSEFGGKRWLLPNPFGEGGGSVQPSELAKIVVVIYIADWLASKGDRIRSVAMGLIPFAVLVGFVAGLIVLQQHLSSAVLVALTALAMFFIAGGQVWQLLLGGLLGSIPFTYLILASDYRINRITGFLSPLEQQADDKNYQVVQSLIALASGGILPAGPGESRQKFGYIPFAHTDNIFAVLGEELGLIGCLVVLGLFAFLAYRGFRVAMNAPDMFGTLLASGLTCMLLFQALLNVAVVTATAPPTGIPLPFISYGGSSLIVSLASIGLLLSVSRGVAVLQPPDRAEEGTFRSETHDLRRGNRRSRVSRAYRHRVSGLWE